MNLPREETWARVDHPDFLHGRSIVNLHELADRIQKGDPAVGWEGDPRICLAKYRDPDTREEWYELWRLEHDGEYRKIARLRGDLDPSNVTRRLVENDTRRGFDVKEAVDRHNAKVEEARLAPSREKLSAAAEKLAWALKRDGAF